jgi:hypothetical protein
MKKKYGILLLLIGGIVISLSLAVNDALAEGEEIIKSRGDSYSDPLIYQANIVNNYEAANTLAPIMNKVVIKKLEPYMNITLGSAWDPYSPRSNKLVGGCFLSQYSADEPIAEDRFQSSFVDSFSSFRQLTSISIQVSGEGRYGAVSLEANAEYQQSREFFNSSKKIVWVVSGERTYQPKSAIAVQLTAKGEQLRKKSHGGWLTLVNPERFYRPCGRSLVTSVNKKNLISLVYIFEASSLNSVDKLKSVISASFSAPTASGQAKVDLIKEVAKADKNVKFQIKVFQNGVADNQSALASLVASSPGDIQAAREKLRETISNISWSKTPIDRFKAEPISDYFEVIEETEGDPPGMYFQISKLKRIQNKLADRYFDLSDLSEKERIGDVTFRPGAKDELEQEIANITNGLTESANAIQQCLRNKGLNCQADAGSNVVMTEGLLRFLDIDIIAFDRWEAGVSGGYDNRRERVVARAKYWPVFYIPNVEFIRRIEIESTDDKTVNNPSYNVVVRLEQDQIDTYIKSGSTLVIKDAWNTGDYSQEWYCWRGRWGEDCAPWGADNRRHANALKSFESKKGYRLKVLDVDGNTTVIPFKNPAEMAY